MSEERGTIIERIERQSEEEAEHLISTARRVAEREVQSARRRARTRERVTLGELSARVAKEKAQAQAEAESEAHRTRLGARHELVERLVGEVLEELSRAARDAAYYEILARLVAEAAEAVGWARAVVTVSAQDREFLLGEGRFERLGAGVAGVELSLSEETVDTAGGAVVASEDGKVLYYNTFEEIAYRRRSELRERIAEILFG